MRLRLVAVALAVTSMVALAFLVPLLLLTRNLARDRAIAAAEQQVETAAQLLSVAGADDDPAAVFTALGFTNLSLILPNDEVIGAPVPPDEDLSGPRSLAAGSQDVAGGAAVYVPVGTSTGEIVVVRAFVPDADLQQNVSRSWVILGGLAVLLVGLAVAAADALGRTIVKPVEDLSDAAQQLSDGDLSARVAPSGPRELARVGAEFNYLAGRVTELLQQERETAADLSHRLRTPLTAARLDAESLARGELRDRLLDDLGELERTIDYIINEARRPARQDPSRADVVDVLTERAVFWDALAEEQERTTELFVASTAPIWCAVDVADLGAAIDALLGNVFAHTPDGTAYAIALARDGGDAVINVDDAGSGFETDEAMTRGHSGGGSTGLGIDIARRTAEAAGGTFELGTSPLGGARVTMRLPILVDQL